MCRNFSKRAQRYMLTHHHYTLEGDGSAMGFENNERLHMAYKSHSMQTFLMQNRLCKCFARVIVSSIFPSKGWLIVA
jgi:hypothetical protein